MKEFTGEIEKKGNDYFLKSGLFPRLMKEELLPPAKIGIDNSGMLFRRVCPICGRNPRRDVHALVVTYQEEIYVICDSCAEKYCPELFKKMKKMQKEFDEENFPEVKDEKALAAEDEEGELIF